MKKNKTLKWEIKDVIAVVLLSLFLILIQFIVNTSKIGRASCRERV